MLTAALRDLQWRRRRFIIAVIGTAFVFAMTLVLTGLANGFRVEARNTVDAFGIDYFLIQNGAVGPFLGSSPFAPTDVARAQRLPGVQSAAGLVYAGITAMDNGTPRTMNMFGAPTDQHPLVPGVQTEMPSLDMLASLRASLLRASQSVPGLQQVMDRAAGLPPIATP